MQPQRTWSGSGPRSPRERLSGAPAKAWWLQAVDLVCAPARGFQRVSRFLLHVPSQGQEVAQQTPCRTGRQLLPSLPGGWRRAALGMPVFCEDLLCAGPCTGQHSPLIARLPQGHDRIPLITGRRAREGGRKQGEENTRFKVKPHGQVTLRITFPLPASDASEI